MSWFETIKSPKLKSSKKVNTNTPSGLWKKCSNCDEILQVTRLQENKQVCPYCDFHFRMTAAERIELITDADSFVTLADNYFSRDPLGFSDKVTYVERLKAASDKTGHRDGVLAGEAKIHGKPVTLSVMNFQFMGGSMGVVAGEKIALAMEKSLEKKIPAITVCCSGGARMQEGILSLMQMGKTSAIRQKLKNEGIPYLTVLIDPTTGGVAASFAMLGDVIMAEPKALIGFAGPRVIEQSIRQTLPDGFQRSEFLKDHGFIDRIVHRHQLKDELSFFINMFQGR